MMRAPPMGHDEHFLQRLDRIDREHVGLALGLYRDHELIRYILANLRVPETAERVAIALEDGGQGPHIVVARNGAFVTCLGRKMSTGTLPIVSRARIDGLAVKVERIREGVALAKKRGFDETRLLARIESAGPAVAREDFVAASAMLGPTVPLVAGVYASWSQALDEMYPLLLAARGWDVAHHREAERDLARGAWAMAHSAMILVHSASREWVREWAKLPAHDDGSPWGQLIMLSAFPFLVRAAWLAGRLGKPMFPSYKARFFKAPHPIEVRESGWGLLCMALRHESLRTEALKALQSPPRPPGSEAWVGEHYDFFALTAECVLRQEQELREEAHNLGRDFIVARTRDLPESSRHRYTERSQVPEDLVLPGLFDGWYDANRGDRGADLMLIAVVAAARARAEDFYFPATVLHAMGPRELDELGESLVEMRRTLVGTPTTVRHGKRPGRNDPCPCGSGKKYKRCHGR
jgi:SEC-C motif